MEIKLQFVKESDIYSGQDTFIFQSDSSLPSLYGTGKRGDLNISRSINKNLIQSTLPVSEYDEGGLCVDIGFCDDTFSIDMITHSWYEYRLLASLVKCNTGMKSGVFTFGLKEDGMTPETFNVAVRNCSFGFVSGRGGIAREQNDMYVKINISLTVVNSKFTT